MTELLTVLIGLTWILALVGVPLLIMAGAYADDVPVVVAPAFMALFVGLFWLCYRVGLTVRPWLVEVLK
jgi:hypothetical protein